MKLRSSLLIGSLFRLILLLWGVYQDSTSSIKYTDIDYNVFSDASLCLVHPHTTPGCSTASGVFAFEGLGDPYSRATYRYTPILAVLTSLNVLIHPVSAKILFIICDLVVAIVLHSLLVLHSIPSSKATSYISYTWLFNPVIANISTRGSAESILGVLVVGTLLLAEKKKWGSMSCLFGLAVHFKIYPIIYGSSLLMFLANNDRGSGWNGWFGRKQIRFAAISAFTFMGLNLVMYLFWGEPFIQHTFLYHIHRLDHRHNFSPYFYSYYLSSTSDSTSSSSSFFSLIRHPLSAFLPQLGLSILLGFHLPSTEKTLSFTMLIQTLTFVTFNKVCTSQYFLWYLWLLPPCIPNLSSIPKIKIITLAIGWVSGQALWLSQAYSLEMLGEPNYLRVWASGVVFLGINCWIITELIKGYRDAESGGKQVLQVHSIEQKGEAKVTKTD